MLPNTYAYYKSPVDPHLRFLVRFDRSQSGCYYLDVSVYAGKLQGVYALTTNEASWCPRGWRAMEDGSWERELEYRDQAKRLGDKLWASLDFNEIEEALGGT